MGSHRMKIKPFKGLRPARDKVRLVASRPYDVLDSTEARVEALGNPLSFLNVVKPEITLPEDVDHYALEVYEAARDNFHRLVEEGVFFQDTQDCLYLYELTMNGRSQDGIVACASVQDYMEGKIKRHELTRPDKEADRKNHVRVSMMNAEPVFLAHPASADVARIVAQIKETEPEYSFATEDAIRHRLWVIADQDRIDGLVGAFSEMPATYVADGHHRTAAAALVGDDRRKENSFHSGEEEYNYFLAAHFPDNQLTILDYNRVVKDLNGHTPASLLKALGISFDVTEVGPDPFKPAALHEFGMYLDGKWYRLNAHKGTYDDTDPIGVLDVTILSEEILKPLFDIHDLRTDKRIDFVGGMRGLLELKRRVDSGEMKVAFALFPVSMKQVTDIADSGKIMPPKTTWFEPKLRSGLVVHSLA
jgi:uncharacterized protein (DUF1015 family)